MSASLPRDVRIYAIGDIHGRADLLEGVLARIDDDLAAYPVARPIHVFLGDYVDRGPHSRRVIDLLIDRAYARETVFLGGNHEVMLREFLRDPLVFGQWRQYGGLDTLLSYGVEPPSKLGPDHLTVMHQAMHEALPPAHRSFLNQLLPSFSIGPYFFVHAGVRPGVRLDEQRPKDMFWIRDEFLDHTGDFGKIVVHGHTPVAQPEVRPNRINIDTGAYRTGHLACLILEGHERHLV